MSLWFERSRTEIAVLEEDVFTTVDLPIESGAAIEIISGKIPAGLELVNTSLIGVPNIVPRNTRSRFVLRATLGQEVEDRTFSITITGANPPEWQTPEGALPIGKGDTFFILDSSPVNFQLVATDPDLPSGQTLSYFIASGDGQLPPGITLTDDGRLIGVVDPLLALEKEAGRGTFDENRFDRFPYDFSFRERGSYDTFSPAEDSTEEAEFPGFDFLPYDFTEPSRVPKKLNRNFEFTVSVSDGDFVSKRTFRILVVGDDFLRADNTIMQVGTGVFTSDNTFVRTPIWLTPSYLGLRRANNFLTLPLEVFDTNQIPGFVQYDLLSFNPDGTESVLPDGMTIDKGTGTVFGRVPYQPAVTRSFEFTVRARRVFATGGFLALQQFAVEETARDSTTIKINKISENTSRAMQVVGLAFTLDETAYEITAVDPFNSEFDTLTLAKTLRRKVTQGETIDLGRISITETEVAEAEKTFTIDILGEVDSTIRWLTPNNLDRVPSNYISTLFVQAETTVPRSFLTYILKAGSLPPGLELGFNGAIIGRIDNSEISATTVFEFAVEARDQFGFSAITRTFSLTVEKLDETDYTDIFYPVLLSQENRVDYRRLLSDVEVFRPEWIYRSNDPRFGVSNEIKILAFAGLEQTESQELVAAMSRFEKRRRFEVSGVKKAVAREPGTRNDVYEVVYLELDDPRQNNEGFVREIKTDLEHVLTADIVRTTPKELDYDSEQTDVLFVDTRTRRKKIKFFNSIPIETRSGDENVSNLVLETRNALEDLDFKIGTATNIFYRPKNENTIRTDSTHVKVSDPVINTVFVASNEGIRSELRKIGKTDRNFLPLWMRTPQPGQAQEQGYTLAIPLAYVKPGLGDSLLSAIRVSEFDFTQFDIEIDRFVIESSLNESEPQYILFQGSEFTV